MEIYIYASEQPVTLYVALCTTLYTLITLYVPPQWIKWLVDMTHNSLCMVIVGQTPSPNIEIINQPCFILMVLQGSCIYFLRAYQLRRSLSIDHGKMLQNFVRQLLLGYND